MAMGAEEPREDPTHPELDELALRGGTLRAVQRSLALAWRLQVAEDHPYLSQRQLGGRQGAFTRNLSGATWIETLQSARHSLRLGPWRRWVEQVHNAVAAETAL